VVVMVVVALVLTRYHPCPPPSLPPSLSFFSSVTEYQKGGGIWRSNDKGQKWRQTKAPAIDYLSVASSHDGQLVIAGTVVEGSGDRRTVVIAGLQPRPTMVHRLLPTTGRGSRRRMTV